MSPRPRKPRRWSPVPRPLPGRRLPRNLRAGRVGVRARSLPDGLADPGFEALLAEIDDSVVHPGNRIEVYTRGDVAFAAMREAISRRPPGAAGRVLHLARRRHRPGAPGRAGRGGGAGRDGAGAGGRPRLLRDPGGVLARDDRSGDRDPPLPPPGAAALEPALPGPPEDPGGRPGGRLHRRHEHHGGVRLVPPRPRGERQAGAGRRGGGALVGPVAGHPRAGRGPRRLGDGGGLLRGLAAGPRATTSRSIRWSNGAPRARRTAERAPGCWSSTPAPAGATPKRRRSCRRSWRRPGSGSGSPTPTSRPGERRCASWGRRRRGVDVRLLLPATTDVPLVRHAGHGHYRALLSRGVRIFEYQRVDPARQVDGRRRPGLGRRLHQPRLPLLPLQRRVQPGDPRRGHRPRGWRRRSRRTWSARRRSRCPPGAAGPALHKLGDRAARLLSPFL